MKITLLTYEGSTLPQIESEQLRDLSTKTPYALRI